jgi:hypothetical protein
VKDGTRTRDRQGHNLELYHLSYLHRRVAVGAPHGGRLGYHRAFAAVIIRRREDPSLRNATLAAACPGADRRPGRCPAAKGPGTDPPPSKAAAAAQRLACLSGGG